MKVLTIARRKTVTTAIRFCCVSSLAIYLAAAIFHAAISQITHIALVK
jgi:hypothetical protein